MSIAQKIASGFNTNGILVGNNTYLYGGRRNMVINGGMEIAQRDDETVASISSTGIHAMDRWAYTDGTDAVVSIDQDTNADLPLVSPHIECFEINVTTADAVLAAGTNADIHQAFLGKELINGGWRKGSSAARPVVISFWVLATKTGINVVEVTDEDNSRFCSASYTINVSNTWEYKTVTIPGDTTGAFTNDGNLSSNLVFWLGAGSDFQTGSLGTTWHTGNLTRAVGQVNNMDSTSNFFRISGIQMEFGTVATPFETQQFQDVLFDCQLHYQKSYVYTTPAAHPTNLGAFYGEVERYEDERADIGGTFVRTFARTPTMKFYALNGGSAGTLGDVSNCNANYAHDNVIGVNSAQITSSGWHGITLSTTVDNIVGYQWTAATGY